MPLLTDADALYIGDLAADAVYLGDTQVWSATIDLSALPGCVLALEADDVPSGAVAGWPDRSPESNDLVPISGTPVAADGYVTLTTVATMTTTDPVTVTGAAPRHLFGVVRSRNVNGAFMGYGLPGESALFDLWNYTGQGTLIWHGYGGPYDTVSGAPAFTPDQWHLIEVSYDGTTIRVGVDEITPAARGVTLGTAASQFLFGQGRYSPAGDFDMKAFYFYDRMLSDTERQQVRDYLTSK